MYVHTRKGLGLGLVPNRKESSSLFIGEPKPIAVVCSDYEKGEVDKSRCQTGACQQGHLVADVIRHPRGLLIADFGVAWSVIKPATKKEKLLQDWMREAKADLYSIVLHIWGYSDCVDKEKHNGVLRAERAKQVYDLLDKDLQSRVNFIGAAHPGDYVADNKTKEGRANNRGVIIELLRLPEEIINIRGTAPPVPCSRTDCQPPPPPKKVQPPPQGKTWKLAGKYSWKGKKRRLLKRGYFEIFGEPEVEATVTVNATDSEFATFALKWEKGKLKGGEFETKFDSWFVPDLKIETDGWTIAFKKEIETFGGKITFKPHLQLSSEIVKTEVVFLPFTIPTTLFGQQIKINVEPKVNVIIKVDVWGILLDRLKKKVKDWLSDLLKDLLAKLGRGVIGSLAGRVLAGLLVLARLFLSDPPTTPVTAPADDIAGKTRALAQAGGTMSAAQILQQWANTNRHAFAKAYADTMLQLTGEKWRERLAGLRSLTVKGYKALPAPGATDKEWQVWTSTRKALEMISIDLPTDNFARRFRWYELMLMFALAAWILRRMTQAELDEAKGIALQQASVAGMAAAVQYVNRRIATDTFEFIDEQGKTQQMDGIHRWDTVGKLVRSAGLSDSDISKRLEPLGAEQLPTLPKIAKP